MNLPQDPRKLSDNELGTITKILLGKVLTKEQSDQLHELITLTTHISSGAATDFGLGE